MTCTDMWVRFSNPPPHNPPLPTPTLSHKAHLPIAVGSVVGRDWGLLLGSTVEGGRVRDGWLMGKIPPLMVRRGGREEGRVGGRVGGREGKCKREGRREEGKV